MDLVNWQLNYRNPDQLLRLGQEATGETHAVRVGQETEKVNLFLHIERGAEGR